MIKIENLNGLKETQELLNEILNAEPYCDFWSAKCRIMKHLSSCDKKEEFLVNALCCMLDYVALKHDSENIKELKNDN